MSRRVQRRAPTLLAIVFLAAILPSGAPRLRALVDEALALRSLPMPLRRPAVLGSWYAEAEKLRDSTTPGTPIDLVGAGTWDSHFALEAGAALHLRDCRYYGDEEARALGNRAAFFEGPHAVNAIGPPPPPADIVVLLDSTAPHPFQVERRTSK